jgi:hypothetical protein
MTNRALCLAIVSVASLSIAACQQILGIKDVTEGDVSAGGDAAVVDSASISDGAPADRAADLSSADDAAAPADADEPDLSAGDGSADGPTCLGMAIACGNSCINPATSLMHCGRCNHSCGGGACVMGVCQPTPVVDGMHVNDLAVDQTGVYFTTGKQVLSCPRNGCGMLAPKQIADMPMETGLVTTMNGNVMFVSAPGQNTTRPTLYICPLTGCPTPVPNVSTPSFSGPSEVVTFRDDIYWIDPDGGLRKRTCAASGGACMPPVQLAPRGITALSVSDTEVFFRDTMANGFGLAKCPNTGCPPAPALPTKLSTVAFSESVYFDGLVYLVRPGRPELPEGMIQTCTAADCNGGTPKVFVNGRNGPSDLVIDRTGLYWLEVTDPTVGAVVYSIRTCPLTGCMGGPRLLAANVKARSLGVDDAFVYWIEGFPADAGASPIMRVAK